MNPYASFLGSSNALDVIAGTPSELEAIVGRLSEAELNRIPAPGKWSVREVICHLADCEIVFAFRIRQALAEDNHIIQPFDQGLWGGAYAAYSAKQALATFTTVRQWNLSLVKTLPEAAFERPLSHPERGPMILRTVIETLGGHDRNHLGQIHRMI